MKTFTDIYSESATTAALMLGYASVSGKILLCSTTKDDQGGILPWWSFSYDGLTGALYIGDPEMGLPGKLVMGSVLLDAATSTLELGGNRVGNGKVNLKNNDGVTTILLDGQNGNVELGGGTADGDLRLKTTAGEEVIVLNASTASVTLGGGGTNGDLFLKTAAGATTVALDAANAILTLGGPGANGDISNSQGGMSLKYHSLVEFAFDERILGDLGLRL